LGSHTHIMKMNQNIFNKTDDTEILTPLFKSMKQEAQGIKVPEGYFDTLSSRIVDRINNRENRSYFKLTSSLFRKPLVWAPVFATVMVVVVLIFVIPAKKVTTIQAFDEQTEINMAYDASYAEEVLLTESKSIDKEIEKTHINYIESAYVYGVKEPTDEEITKYLQEQEIDADILNEH